jgi:hypothetical protein
MDIKTLAQIRSQVDHAKAQLGTETNLYDDSFCNDLGVLDTMNAALRALDEATRHLKSLQFADEPATVQR